METAFQRAVKLGIWAIPLTIALNATAASFYVSTNGSDSADGSSGTPWQTIQKGLNSVSAGDTLFVLNTTFPRGSNYTKFNGTSGNPITIQGVDGNTNLAALFVTNSFYLIRGLNFYSNHMWLYGTNANDNVVESNRFERTRGVNWFSPALPYTNGPSRNIVRYNWFTNMAYATACMGVTGFGNYVDTNVWWTGNDNDAINFFGISNSFRGNLFVEMSPSAEHIGNHIDMFQTFGDTGQEGHHCLIENNVVSNSAGHFFIFNSLGPGNTNNNYAVSHITVRNNLIIGGGGDSFIHAPDITVVNNTFWGNDSGVPSIWVRDIEAYGFPSNAIVLNNIVAESSANVFIAVDANYTNSTIFGWNFMSGTGGRSQSSNPGVNSVNGGYAGFVSTNGTLNFNVSVTSTNYRTGTNLTFLGFSNDLTGIIRLDPWNRGALEFDDYAPTISTNNVRGGRVAGFRGLSMEVLPLPASHNHPASPLLFEDFEASGYTTEGWDSVVTGTGNAINPDNTTNVLSGSQSFALVGISDNPSYATNSFSASSEVFGYLEFKCLKYPSEDGDAYRQILRLEKEDGTPLFNLMMFNTGVLYIQTGGTSDGTAAFGALTLGQTYYIWFSWDKNNGSNSAATMSVSTSKVRPTSGDGFVSITGTTIADDATRIMIGYDNTSNEGNAAFNGAPSWIYDYVLLDDVQIPDYP